MIISLDCTAMWYNLLLTLSAHWNRILCTFSLCRHTFFNSNFFKNFPQFLFVELGDFLDCRVGSRDHFLK